jgi:hypothetical protein
MFLKLAGRSPAADAGTHPGLTLAAVTVAQFMVSVDHSVVHVGLPRVAVGLGFSAACPRSFSG